MEQLQGAIKRLAYAPDFTSVLHQLNLPSSISVSGVASMNQEETTNARPVVGRPVTARAATSPSLPNLNDHM